MKSRMDRYNDDNENVDRLTKNEKLYNQAEDINVEYIDINSGNVFDITELNKETKSREDYRKLKHLDMSNLLEKPVIEEKNPVQPRKTYDINEILEEARKNNLFAEERDKKRLINTEYNILTKLDIENIDKETEAIKKENLRHLIDTIYSNSLAEDVKKKNENQDLLQDLCETKKEDPLSESISRNILAKEETETKPVSNDNVEIKKTVEQTPVVTNDDANVTPKSTEQLATMLNETFVDNTLITTGKMKEEFSEVEQTSPIAVIIGVVLAIIILGVGIFLFIKFFGTF